MLHSDIAEIAAVALGGGSSNYRDDQQGGDPLSHAETTARIRGSDQGETVQDD